LDIIEKNITLPGGIAGGSQVPPHCERKPIDELNEGMDPWEAAPVLFSIALADLAVGAANVRYKDHVSDVLKGIAEDHGFVIT
jgi:hypothetical protein